MRRRIAVFFVRIALLALFCSLFAGCGHRAPKGEVLFDDYASDSWSLSRYHGHQSLRTRHVPALLPHESPTWMSNEYGMAVKVEQ